MTISADDSKAFWSATIVATLVAGTLDISSVFVFAGMAGVGPIDVLKFVASGPFGDGIPQGNGKAAVGLLVHFGITACIAAAYMIVAQRCSSLLRYPVLAGLIYGLLVWLLMYWIVMPLRWPAAPLPHTLYDIANQLFSHSVLVGLPVAVIATRKFAKRRDGT